jgi:hypothetical protein
MTKQTGIAVIDRRDILLGATAAAGLLALLGAPASAQQ